MTVKSQKPQKNLQAQNRVLEQCPVRTFCFAKRPVLYLNIWQMARTTQAAINAGYSSKTARLIGQENLLKPAIAALLAQKQTIIAARQDESVLILSNITQPLQDTEFLQQYAHPREAHASKQKISLEKQVVG